MRFFLFALSLLAAPALAQPVDQGPKNVPEFTPEWPNQTRAPALKNGVQLSVEVLAEGLDHPWGIAVLPGGGYLVTERAGQLRVLRDGTLGDPVQGVPSVDARRQGGLLDVALAQDFDESRVIYLSYAKRIEDGLTATAVARGVLSDDATELDEVSDIFIQSPPSPTPMHYGSRVIPHDGMIYITTGEHFTQTERQKAQEIPSTFGKVVRLSPEGVAPPDNPFADQGAIAAQVWSLGHRNIQGAAIRPDGGDLWVIEHGPAGGDELNLIEKGANYGWPLISYGQTYGGSPIGTGEPRMEGMTAPRYYWDPVIAPGGMIFYDGDMFSDWRGDVLTGSLNPGGLVRLRLEGDKVTGEERFLDGEFRVRDVAMDRDGALLLLDDSNGRVLRLTPE